MEYIEILRYIARILKVNPEGKGILDLTDDIKVALTKASLHGQQVVLIIDEAHLLSIASLEHIRLLSNIEITAKKLLQILLIGQNELSHKLRRREMRQLRQRLNVNRVLSHLSRSETFEYIDHRLQVAGSGFDKCFESECEKPIYKMTGGVPRSINRLCDTALLICMTEKGAKVTERVLQKAHDALESDVILAPGESKFRKFFSVENFSAKILKPALAVGSLVFVLSLGFLGYRGNVGENLKDWIYDLYSHREVNTQVVKPLPPVSEVKTEESSEPPEAGEENASTSVPGPVTPQAPEVKSEEISKPPEAGEKNASASVPGPVTPQAPEVKSEEVSKPLEAVGKNASAGVPGLVTPQAPEVKSEEVSKPLEAVGKNASAGMPGPVTPQAPEVKSEEVSKPPEAGEKNASAGMPGPVTPQAPEVKSEEISKPPEAGEKNVSAGMPGPVTPQAPEVKSEEISKPPEAEEKNASAGMPGPVTPQAPEVKSEEVSKPPEAGEKNASAGMPGPVTPQAPEAKSEEVSKPPQAGEKNASAGMPGPVMPQAPGPEQKSSRVLPEEGEPAGNIDANVTKTETAAPSVKEPSAEKLASSSTPSEETQAKDRIPDANGESTQAQGRVEGREIAAGSENPGADAQNPQTGEKTLESSDAFTIIVQKGDILTRIAEQWFPEDPESGLKSILSANPAIKRKNRILVGQILRIPRSKEEVNR